MQISTLITVGSGNFAGDADWAAAQVLAALGGNPANDTSTARVDEVTLSFSVSVTLESGDNMPYTAEQAADQVMAALGGNPTTDKAYIAMSMPLQAGTAGVDE